MAELGVALLTFATTRTQDFVDMGRCAEEQGYAACYTTESLTDTLAIDLAILLGTSRIRVGSFVAVSYLRHPVVAAQMAVTAANLSGGRFVLGVGLGHRVRVEALGLTAGSPMLDLPAYVRDVKAILDGRGRVRYPGLPVQPYREEVLDFPTSEHPVPVYTAAVGPRMAEAGAAVSDGLMVWLVPQAGIGELRSAAARAGDGVPIDVAVHAYVSDDIDAARDAARASLGYWLGLPAYNEALVRSGYEEEATRIAEAVRCGDRAGLRTAITDRLVDEYCVVGPRARCRDQLQGWHDTGAATLALVPHPVRPAESYVDGVRRSLEALSPA
jgi:5,10-methylenetetrahydromethanopterin reductase